MSSTLGGTSRRDSWDAIAKTKAMLSYGSLESLANLANGSTDHTTTSTNNFSNNNNYINGYNNYNSLNVERSHKEHTKNHTTQQRFVSNDYRSSSPKYNGGGGGGGGGGSSSTMENHNGRGYTHGILKNKNNNYHKGADTTDAVHERFVNNETSFMSSQERRKGSSSAFGTALDVLPIHKPTSFTLDSSIDGSKAVVTITGKFLMI